MLNVEYLTRKIVVKERYVLLEIKNIFKQQFFQQESIKDEYFDGTISIHEYRLSALLSELCSPEENEIFLGVLD